MNEQFSITIAQEQERSLTAKHADNTERADRLHTVHARCLGRSWLLANRAGFTLTLTRYTPTATRGGNARPLLTTRAASRRMAARQGAASTRQPSARGREDGSHAQAAAAAATVALALVSRLPAEEAPTEPVILNGGLEIPVGAGGRHQDRLGGRCWAASPRGGETRAGTWRRAWRRRRSRPAVHACAAQSGWLGTSPICARAVGKRHNGHTRRWEHGGACGGANEKSGALGPRSAGMGGRRPLLREGSVE